MSPMADLDHLNDQDVVMESADYPKISHAVPPQPGETGT
jgi:hypothetical protein